MGVIRNEFGMSVRRKGFWLAYGLLLLFYGGLFVLGGQIEVSSTQAQMGQASAEMAFTLNMFFPLVGGILLADRLVRDRRLGVDELLGSTPLGRVEYLLGKYIGGLLSILMPVFFIYLALMVCGLALGASLRFSLVPLLAFLAIVVPAYVFITAFSLACPLVMPVRVYQILFTGYWFWGNYLNPEFIPTLNGTLLTPGGKIAMEGFFGVGGSVGDTGLYTPTQAVLNLVVLAACAGLALAAAERFLAWRASQA